MTRPRADIVNLEHATHYQQRLPPVMCRCVRRAFLCGEDFATGRSYNQQPLLRRKQWIVERLATISNVFAVDIMAYAIMSNHYHLVVRLRTDPLELTDREVVERWLSIYTGDDKLRLYLNGDLHAHAASELENSVIPVLRDRLHSLSWIMSCLNQQIAVAANKEDDVTGHFWQARYKSHGLIDEAAIIACMTHNDLNPIRAGIASSLEDSHFTSAKQRIDALHPDTSKLGQASATPKVKLVNLDNDTHPNALPMTTVQYLELLGWSGKVQHHGKRGFIQHQTPSVLESLNINASLFRQKLPEISKSHSNWIARTTQLQEIALARAQRFVKGVGKITAIS